ncbi:MAG: DnaJ C-terminal domain-containing protein [bacterium]|nr:DnaJ C-terminal domain-containing protein [bacterium]
MKDYYKILGVERGATEDDIKKAYRKLAHQYHPDKSGGSADKFKEINEAYQILSNKEKKEQFDRFGRVHDGQTGGSPFGNGSPFGSNFEFGFGFDPSNIDDMGNVSEIFEAFFEGMGVKKRNNYRRGSDVEFIQELTLEEAFRGTEKLIRTKIYSVCEACTGIGYDKTAGTTECATCSGRGEIKESRNTFFGNFAQVKTCPKCVGSGQVPNKPCDKCGNAGRVLSSREITVEITPGVSDDQLIKITKAGEAGERGAEAGDLYVRIRIAPHKIFERRGDDLVTKKQVDLVNVLLGEKIEIFTIGGNKLHVEIPAGISLKDKMRIPGEGMNRFGGRGRGDLYVEWDIKTPKKVSSKVKKLLEELKDELN